MNQSVLGLLLATTLTLSTTLRCQTPPLDFEALDALMKFELGADGQILMTPDASSASWRKVPLVDRKFERTLANGGVLAWLTLVSPGGDDVVSLADAPAILRRLGRSDDPELFTAIRAKGGSAHERLLRILAIDVVRDRQVKQALGLLEVIVKDESADVWTRRAAGDAVAALRGQPLPRHARPLPALRDVLAQAPESTTAAIVLDYRHLPSARGLLGIGRELGIETTKRAIVQAGGSVSPFAWAGAVQMSEAPGAAPYELARRFGNFHLERVVVATCGTESLMSDSPSGWFQIDGLFERERIVAALRELEIEVAEIDDVAAFEYDGLRIEVSSRWLRGSAQPVEEAVLGVEPAKRLAEALTQPGAGFVMRWRDSVEAPELMSGWPLPRALTLWVPHGERDTLRLVADGVDKKIGDLVAMQVKGFPRLVESWLDQLEQPEKFDSLLEALETLKLERQDGAMTVEVSFDGVDFRQLIREAARSGQL